MMNTNSLASAMIRKSHAKLTENGAYALDSSLDPIVDLFAEIGALRERSDDDIINLFERAYSIDKLLVTKILFYARDIREGLGERRTFRILLKHCADAHPEAIRNNIGLIGEYGRYDDLYMLIGTKLEAQMWETMKAQFLADFDAMAQNKPISLLAKWIKTPDASSKATRALGILTARKLGYSVYDFKRLLRKLRKYLKIVEATMSAQQWSDIDYQAVPSRAAMLYRKTFWKHDADRYSAYIEDVKSGDKKINAGTLYPYDILERYCPDNVFTTYHFRDPKVDDTLEELWKALPNYVSEDAGNMLVMADVSGSMNGRPMATSVGLAIYFAERNTGDFKNMFMTFSRNPSVVDIRGRTLLDKIKSVFDKGVGYDTNIEKAFDALLDMAIDNNTPADQMPSALIIISDMEFNNISDSDSCWRDDIVTDMSFYDTMKSRYEHKGYTIPHIVFWNVNARHDTFHTEANIPGTTLLSGQSVTAFKNFISAIEGMTPIEFMLMAINVERYSAITIAE